MQRQALRRPNRKLSLFLLFLIAVLPFGCSDSAITPSSPPPSAPKVQKQTIVSSSTKTTPEEKKRDVYAYKPVGRRDPFAPIIVRENKKAKGGERPPLERYNIVEFKLAGIIWGGFGYNVMLEGPDGKGYFVRVGTIIGPNRGVVKKITQNQMVIEEHFKSYTGKTERKEIVVELKKKQEATP